MADPWEIHPDLTLSRLQLIEAVLRDTRHRTLRLHDPIEGDSAWSLGCRVYARSCHALIQAARQWPWLRILDAGLQFIFAIGAVPVRFYHGDSQSPPLDLAPPEALQLALCYGDAAAVVWRIAVETTDLGEVWRIVLIGAHGEGRVDVRFTIPPDDRLVAFALPPLQRDVSPSPPEVTARGRRSESEPKT
jgi:hypothetical protein